LHTAEVICTMQYSGTASLVQALITTVSRLVCCGIQSYDPTTNSSEHRLNAIVYCVLCLTGGRRVQGTKGRQYTWIMTSPTSSSCMSRSTWRPTQFQLTTSVSSVTAIPGTHRWTTRHS